MGHVRCGDQTGIQVLWRRARPAGGGDVAISGGAAGQLQLSADAISDEGKGSAPLEGFR